VPPAPAAPPPGHPASEKTNERAAKRGEESTGILLVRERTEPITPDLPRPCAPGYAARVWRSPAWDPARVVFEDEDLLVVDKPHHLSTHAPDPSRPGVVERLREAGWGYLGVHQRLDKGTSGVLLFTKREEANAGIAAAMEGRRAEKRYLAIAPVPKQRTGEAWHRLAREGERVRATPIGPREVERLRDAVLPADVAVTAWNVLEVRGALARIELAPKTGRTHQLRAVLAAAGSPIVGDEAYGGAPAFRMLLHARSLRIAHPRTGEAMTFEAPVPDSFAFDRPAIGDALARVRAAAERRHELWTRDAFRLVNGEGDDLPGVELDRYGDWLVLGLASDEALAREAELVAAAAALEPRGVYVKRRPKQASTVADAEKKGLASRLPSWGEPAEGLVVDEDGAKLRVELGGSLSTGVFLDQRETRAAVRAESAGARVLNLFCYAGAFTIAAARGGALATTSVDVSAAALDRARENLALNDLDPAAHALVKEDVRAWLALARHRATRWDVLVLDPPSFASTKGADLRAPRDYAELVAGCARVAAGGARIFCVQNHAGTSRAALRDRVREGAALAGRAIERLRDLPEPADFPSAGARSGRAKVVVAVLGGAITEATAGTPPRGGRARPRPPRGRSRAR